MKIAMSCIKVKRCSKCGDNVYSFEIRKNRNNGTVEHLKCPVSDLLRWAFEQVKVMNGQTK